MNAWFANLGAWVLSHEHGKGRDGTSIDELLEELAELRELDRRRNAHAPGSSAHESVSREVESRTRRLMDRFRDLKTRRAVYEPAPAALLHVARRDPPTTIGVTRTG